MIAEVKVQVQAVFGVGDEVDWKLNGGGRIKDKIVAIEPASYISDSSQLSPILLAISKIYFKRNPDLAYALGSFKEFKKMRLEQEDSELVISLGA